MTATVPNGRLTPIEELRGKLPKLLAGDIVFIRHKKSFFRRYLRAVTESYWDHATMILYPRSDREDRPFSIVVESIKHGFKSALLSRGVSLHRLDKYLHDPEAYDVGIKRVPDLTDDDRRRVQLFMLMNVDAPYWPWQPLDVMFAAYSKRIRDGVLHRQRFSCSSLIQKAYYDAMPWDRKPRVIFKEGTWSPIELQELTNPGDIARSRNSDWIYNEQSYDGRGA